MFDFHEKRKLRRIVYSWPLIAFVFFLALIVGKSAYGRFLVEREMAARLVEHTQELSALEERAQGLHEKVLHLQDERGIEEELRSRFDVVKKGEQVAVIVDDEVSTGSPVEREDHETRERGTVMHWLRGFFE